MKRPAIILTSKFSTETNGKSFGKYLGYMARKEALESKEYLTEQERKEINRVTIKARELDIHGKFRKVFDQSKDELVNKQAKKLLNNKVLSELNDDQFSKYLGYMARSSALATIQGKRELTPQETQELKRVNEAANKLTDLKVTKDKLAVGFFTSDMDQVHLKDFQHIRDQLTKAQANHSVLWQDVISFDNDFLVKKGILNKETGMLDEQAMRHASQEMMKTFQAKMNPPLYQPYWMASIHRNTDNVHIHFATVEAINQQPIIEREDKFGNLVKQPKGRRPQKVIDQMKSVFTNTLINTSDLTKEISRNRDQVRANVFQHFEKQKENPDFQAMINQFMEHLPADRRNWNYKWLEKNDANGKALLDIITETLLKDDQDYRTYKKDISDYQDTRQALYGISKRENKNYKVNKLKDIRRRNGNAVLKSLATLDKQANKMHKKTPLKLRVNPEMYFQTLLNKAKTQKSSSGAGGRVAPARRNVPRKRNLYLFTLSKKRIEKLKKEISHQTRKEMILEKGHVSLDKRKALTEYEKIQKAAERSQE
ncbi:MobP2 family relaxase [Lactobacillus paragasseri]|uniref:MobP2 family relaxase n=1 Tax=Lactobacillus paragasseri TaxID=2107999 RepID=UPI003B9BBD04